MIRFIYLIFKRGDLDHHHHLQAVHGYDPLDWNHTEAQEAVHFSQFMTTGFLVIRCNRLLKPFLWAGLSQLRSKPDPENMLQPDFQTSFMVDEVKLSNILQDPDFSTKLRDGRNLGIIHCEDSLDITKPIIDISSFEDAYDIHTINQGLHLHGTGETYSDYTVLLADVFTALFGNMEARQTSDQTLVNAASLITNLQTYDFSYTSNNPHFGNVKSGWTTTINHNGHGIHFVCTGSAGGGVKIGGISLIRTVDSALATTGLLVGQNPIATYQHFGNLFIDGNGKTGVGARSFSSSVNFFNLAIRDCSNEGILSLNQLNGEVVFEQILVHGCVAGVKLYGYDQNTFKNVACVDNEIDYVEINSAVGDYCIDSDDTAENGDWGTGTNMINGVTPEAEYELDPTKRGYAGILETAPNANSSGIHPTTDPNLMEGNAQVAEIGPKQVVLPAGGLLMGGGMTGLNGRYFNSEMNGGLNG